MDPSVKKGQKRSLEHLTSDITLSSPVKKKICDITKFYRKLYLDGENSDITLNILNKQYFLHKVFLCQSPYFASMFGGAWLESNEKSVTIELVDDIITLEALNKIFEALYTGTITITPAEAVSVLAAATMFQLNGIIKECTDMMIETISQETVVPYYEASCQYDSIDLKRKCFEYLLLNSVRCSYVRPDMPLDVVQELVTDPDLFCEGGEMDVYNFLKIYVFCKENERLYESGLEDEYFLSKTGDEPYLCTGEGLKYGPLFRKLRWQSLITSAVCLEKVIIDNIIPEDWLMPVVMRNWKAQVLREKFWLMPERIMMRETPMASYYRKSFYIENDSKLKWPEFGRRCITVRRKITHETKNSIVIRCMSLEPNPKLGMSDVATVKVVATKLNSRHQPQSWARHKIVRVKDDITPRTICKFVDLTFPIWITFNTKLVPTHRVSQLSTLLSS